MNQAKNNLIDKINTIDDEKLIIALGNILEKLDLSEIHKISRGEKKLIELGLADYEKGKLIDDADLRQEEEEWLKK